MARSRLAWIPAAALLAAAPAQATDASASAGQQIAAPADALGAVRRSAASGSWEEFYLALATADPARCAPSARAEIARLSLSGASAPGVDRVLALALAEISLRFEQSAAALSRAAELALDLGEQGAARQYLDMALAHLPGDDRLRLLRAHLARAERDWATAERLYASIGAASPERAAAQQALDQIASAQAEEEAQAIEAARRDLLRRRAEAEQMAAALPVSDFELCRAHTIAACEAIATCRQLAVNCALLIDSCPASRTDSGLPRAQLPACAEVLSKIDCASREAAIARLSSGTCRGLGLRTERRLLPEGAEDRAADRRAPPGAVPSGDVRRLLEQVELGN